MAVCINETRHQDAIVKLHFAGFPEFLPGVDHPQDLTRVLHLKDAIANGWGNDGEHIIGGDSSHEGGLSDDGFFILPVDLTGFPF